MSKKLQESANEFAKRIGKANNRADQVLDILVDSKRPAREDERKRIGKGNSGASLSILDKVGRTRGPQKGGKAPGR